MAMTKTKRRKRASVAPTSMPVAEFLRRRVTMPDTRSHAEFLQGMREEQAAGRLASPATAGLLERLERATDGVGNR